MTGRNPLLATPPYAVARELARLGESLRTARVRRNLTIKEVSEKIGTGPRAIMDAERGKASTGAGIYLALLWAYDLLSQLSPVASPAQDEQGLRLAASREKTRARKSIGLDNDF